MAIQRNPLTRRITAGLGIAALAAAALLGSVLPANAADPGPGNINPATTKSLTIHKFAQPGTLGTAPDGNPLPGSATSGLTALDGVTFKIQKVTNIDLSTNAGWLATKNLTPAGIDPANLGAAVSGLTANGGVLTFPNLAQAVYLVTETDPGAHNIAFAAKPFLVTLPLPNNRDNTWIYEVHVYPKNSLTSVTKAVDDSMAKGLGSDVTWNIGAQVPNVSQGNTLMSFAITDALDSRLSYKSASVTLAPATATLIAATDYNIDTTTTAGTVAINFTAAGLLKLRPGAQVNVGLVTTVTSLGLENGVITNRASTFVNGTKFTSNQVQSTWGNLLIRKVAGNDQTKTLQGAEFQVYASEADAKAGSNPIAVSGSTVFTSGVDGMVTLDGLRATVNGTATVVDYWIVETKAPAGYTIATDVSQASPKKFTVTAGKVSTVVDITVANPQTPPFMLPLTGGPGTVAFMTIGFGLLTIAAGVALRKRSTRRATQS
ncbi:SpaH/EbpB family LPXTG-anchored major pilin [Arthrobacter sp. HLT1-20]